MPHSPLRRTASNSRLSPSIYQPPLAHKKVLEMRYAVASRSFLTFAHSRNILRYGHELRPYLIPGNERRREQLPNRNGLASPHEARRSPLWGMPTLSSGV